MNRYKENNNNKFSGKKVQNNRPVTANTHCINQGFSFTNQNPDNFKKTQLKNELLEIQNLVDQTFKNVLKVDRQFQENQKMKIMQKTQQNNFFTESRSQRSKSQININKKEFHQQKQEESDEFEQSKEGVQHMNISSLRQKREEKLKNAAQNQSNGQTLKNNFLIKRQNSSKNGLKKNNSQKNITLNNNSNKPPVQRIEEKREKRQNREKPWQQKQEPNIYVNYEKSDFFKNLQEFMKEGQEQQQQQQQNKENINQQDEKLKSFRVQKKQHSFSRK